MSTAHASSVSPSCYTCTNTAFNQSVHMLSLDCFLNALSKILTIGFDSWIFQKIQYKNMLLTKFQFFLLIKESSNLSVWRLNYIFGTCCLLSLISEDKLTNKTFLMLTVYEVAIIRVAVIIKIVVIRGLIHK